MLNLRFNHDEPEIDELIPEGFDGQDFSDFEGLSYDSELPDGQRLSFVGDVEGEEDFPY